MELVLEQIGDVSVIAVKAEFLDASNSRAFKEQIAPHTKTCRKMVLDLSKVNFIDSTGCGALLTGLKQVTAEGGDMKLCGITKPVQALFKLVRMERILQVCDTREEAVSAFARKSETPA